MLSRSVLQAMFRKIRELEEEIATLRHEQSFFVRLSRKVSKLEELLADNTDGSCLEDRVLRLEADLKRRRQE